MIIGFTFGSARAAVWARRAAAATRNPVLQLGDSALQLARATSAKDNTTTSSRGDACAACIILLLLLNKFVCRVLLLVLLLLLLLLLLAALQIQIYLLILRIHIGCRALSALHAQSICQSGSTARAQCSVRRRQPRK